MTDINETSILDEMIVDLQKRIKAKPAFKDMLKLQEMMLKALAMRRKERGKKGRGFDLGTP